MISCRITLLLTFSLLLVSNVLFAQESNLVMRKIQAPTDTLVLDTLTIYPASFRAYCQDEVLDTTDYYFNGVDRTFLLKEKRKDNAQLDGQKIKHLDFMSVGL